MEPCRHDSGTRALRSVQAVRQTQKGHLVAPPEKRLETQTESVKFHTDGLSDTMPSHGSTEPERHPCERLRYNWIQSACDLLTKLEKIGPEIVEFSNGFIKGISQLGEFSLMTTPRLLDTESNTRVIDTQVYLEDPAEILAKKIQYRILHNGILVARDLFDIATAYEIAPAALVSALQTITLDERLDIASEIRSLPMQWVGGGESGRELINPLYPKSLATNPEQLISSVERLFRNGPEPLLAQLASGKLTSNPDRMGN